MRRPNDNEHMKIKKVLSSLKSKATTDTNNYTNKTMTSAMIKYTQIILHHKKQPSTSAYSNGLQGEYDIRFGF